jgi:hypothetical protein
MTNRELVEWTVKRIVWSFIGMTVLIAGMVSGMYVRAQMTAFC